MRWLVTGGSGMLATDVVGALRAAGEHVEAPSRADLDVTDDGAVRAAVVGHDVVVNCAAWTAVDDAESEEAAAFAVNALGPARLAAACAGTGARLVQVSTDYVFDGRVAGRVEDAPSWRVDDPVAPRSAYGRTKLAGEWAVRAACPDHLVLRTAWLYGAAGRCFPRTIAAVASAGRGLEVVEDQVGQPTWTADVAALVIALVRARAAPGTYHATSGGRTSWFGFAREVVTAAGGDPSVVRPVPTDPGARPAVRPTFSALDPHTVVSAGVAPIGHWRQRWAEAAPVVLGGGL